ncbi:MAG: exodeoxyribonuclease VII small subunit [Candidatus Omnitrophica bacterium]|jgi:exodeoxyribonuclease VII small subunit|nr:exodeoxyribonuclease VII small subunit [Candidatus Omnitrophota bacterium]MCF7895738.1 exodeoxyribonuclease VII small subunit [Candidatus Omnitrophota bacterium]MCF7897629.1 exodeoxyribonuclease VII small subunit [Candidatus Omnitrophota bacterium]MCF7909601.1 exodeoxyribonuclease VII small subunit [Candidatus Omnitrophota bacterium]
MAKKEVKYSQAVDELNQILADLEAERIDVDQVSTKVKKAVELIKLCRERIENTEMEVKTIVKEFEGAKEDS